MRSVDVLCRAVAAALVTLAAGGCASIGEPLKAVQQAIAPAATAIAAAPAAVIAVVQTEPPVGPAAQRAFDDATRALKAGRTDEAERGFRALVQSNPELGGPHANLGLIYRQAGKLPQSATELEQAVKLSPKQAMYFNHLGVTYRQQGQFEKAREAYEKAIALDANYPAPYLNLGILHDLYLNDGPRALELYDRYLALSPGGDAMVTKWVAELKNRKSTALTGGRKEKA